MNQPNPRALPVWRSLLYVPANVERYLAKAHQRGADGIILDLEDSVPPAEKANARVGLQETAARVGQGGADVLVRINRPLRLAIPDLEAAVGPAVRGIFVTKVEGPGHLRLLDEVVSELEAERGMPIGSTGFVAMIETAHAFFQIREVATATGRLDALTIGAEDLSTDVGAHPDADTLLYPKQQSIYAARAAGIAPLGIIGTVADYTDLDAVRATAFRSRKFGFEGASCIHPAVVPVLNEAFGVSDADAAQARRIIEADNAAAAEGRASFALDGKMVDIPVVERARRLLARHQAIAARAGGASS
jgi:citrate lyase subunit beta/citryl-CoA lyase